jgi:AAA lid domain/ATPase family associated with various cellular activities (AAA)
MSTGVPPAPSLFCRTLDECRELYVSSGSLVAEEHAQLLAMPGEKYVALMDDLHRALLVKVYIAICEADREWSNEERRLAEVLFEHLWGRRLTGDGLCQAARKAASQASKLKWYSLVRPFDQVVPLRDRVGTLETLVMRLANLIARADGRLDERETAAIKLIQDELRQHLRPIPIDESNQHEEANAIGAQAAESLNREAAVVYAASRPQDSNRRSPRAVTKPSAGSKKTAADGPPNVPARVTLKQALAELDALIGLDRIKDEIRTLANFLKLQQRREKAGLPETDVSLHMVFTGNPGTGKTSVARCIGHIFGAMGILERGHLVETDRSGLVAEYIGQTGPKTNKKIDEALGGVLFIDEAYSLVAKRGDDPFGHEAVQTLLKRAEDDRERLVVILAGYPDEMRRLLESNPGLSSRFSRQMHFDDYSPLELGRIFGAMCDKNHYRLGGETRAKTILGLAEIHRSRDRHFGNGRTVRNVFEQAIRRMANRIADIEDLSHEELTLLDAADIEFKSLTIDWLAALDFAEARFRLYCPGCKQSSTARGSFLGRKVRCGKCQHDFAADWGEPVEA